jgi:hypothetical protein
MHVSAQRLVSRTKTRGPTKQVKNLVHFQTDILRIFVQHLFSGSGGETDFLSTFTFQQLRKESHVETSVNWHHISNVFQLRFVPFIGWRPGQLPGWPTPYSGPACETRGQEAVSYHTMTRWVCAY